MKMIHFAGGCFWGLEHYLKNIDGVVSTEVGFANGSVDSPTYEQVYTDTTGHAETVAVTYDPAVIPLKELLEDFFCAIDPYSVNKQGEDEGTRYRTGIYYSSPEDLPVILEDEVARMANAAALVKERMGFFWVGFYVVKDGELVLGPFQGPVACTRIGFGKGVCGTAWKEAKTIVVPDVEEFPGHIACSSMSKSEIVVPVFKDGSVTGVLDIDSDSLATFDKVDAHWLGRIAALV